MQFAWVTIYPHDGRGERAWAIFRDSPGRVVSQSWGLCGPLQVLINLGHFSSERHAAVALGYLQEEDSSTSNVKLRRVEIN